MTLKSGTRIVTSDDGELGKVHQVVADTQKDIFSGVTYKHGLLGSEHFVPADLIEDITEEEVRLSVSTSDAEQKIQAYEG